MRTSFQPVKVRIYFVEELVDLPFGLSLLVSFPEPLFFDFRYHFGFVFVEVSFDIMQDLPFLFLVVNFKLMHEIVKLFFALNIDGLSDLQELALPFGELIPAFTSRLIVHSVLCDHLNHLVLVFIEVEVRVVEDSRVVPVGLLHSLLQVHDGRFNY